jgi:uncharacterized repeat protein (TIGR03803 family)
MQSQRLVAGVRWTITLLFVIVVHASSARAVTETVLHSFTGTPDGASPFSGLVVDNGGNLYGTTLFGGRSGHGTVFELIPESGGGWKERVLYSFAGGLDGANPIGGVVFDEAGNLYGTTENGGASGDGTVFELSPSGGSWTENIVYAFGGEPDGCNPEAGPTFDSAGNLYGTTEDCGSFGGGAVFELSRSGGGWDEAVIWSFNGTDGAAPHDTPVFDKAGDLFGTTQGGGGFAQGNVFKLTLGSEGWTETSIFSFTGGGNGCAPSGGVILSAGDLFGTTSECGTDDVGTVFELTPTIGQWRMFVLHTFTGGRDGGEPVGGLKLDSGGNLYGTTPLGGRFGYGTIFKLAATNDYDDEVEYSLMGGDADGATPYSGLTFNKGAAFGTTLAGGANGLGTVYEITAK